jgi:hypothetical protein
MSDTDGGSRTAAVGRKRKRDPDQLSSRSSSRESGEISSDPDTNMVGNAFSTRTYAQTRTTHTDYQLLNADNEDNEKDRVNGKGRKAASSSDSMSTSDSDSDSSEDDESHTNTNMVINDGLTRIHQLTAEDRELQWKYFNIDNPSDLVFCLTCGDRGHVPSVCPHRTCEHCGERDEHAASACSLHRKCSRCRSRGHDARYCHNRTYYGNDKCDICDVLGHLEEECPRLWCNSIKPSKVLRQILARDLIKACYCCGASDHWGNDCRHVDRRELNAVKTWSASNAQRFIKYDAISLDDDDDDDQYEPQPSDKSTTRYGKKSNVKQASPQDSWQTALFDDGRD